MLIKKNLLMKDLKYNNNKYRLNLKIENRQFYFFFKLINNLIMEGKKDIAFNIVNDLILLIMLKYKNEDPFIILDKNFCKTITTIKIKKKRISGRVHHVPLFLKKVNQINYSLKLFVDSVRLRNEKTIVLKLFAEILDLVNEDVNAITIKKKKAIYTQALTNKFYIKFL